MRLQNCYKKTATSGTVGCVFIGKENSTGIQWQRCFLCYPFIRLFASFWRDKKKPALRAGGGLVF